MSLANNMKLRTLSVIGKQDYIRQVVDKIAEAADMGSFEFTYKNATEEQRSWLMDKGFVIEDTIDGLKIRWDYA